jgi:hypothetical protein
MAERTFVEIQEELAARYQPEFDKVQSAQQHGEVMLAFILERERLRNHASVPGPAMERCDLETLTRLANPDALGPECSLQEAVFRRLARAPSEGMLYQDAARKVKSAKQSERAKKPRPRSKDSITRAIEEILEESPYLTAREIGQALKGYDGITFIEDEYRHTLDASTMSQSNLPSRVSNAKKRLSA